MNIIVFIHVCTWGGYFAILRQNQPKLTEKKTKVNPNSAILLPNLANFGQIVPKLVAGRSIMYEN